MKHVNILQFSCLLLRGIPNFLQTIIYLIHFNTHLGVSRNHTLLYQEEGDQLPHHQQLMLVIGYPWCEGPQQRYHHLFHEGPKQGLGGNWRSHPLERLNWNISNRILILVQCLNEQCNYASCGQTIKSRSEFLHATIQMGVGHIPSARIGFKS